MSNAFQTKKIITTIYNISSIYSFSRTIFFMTKQFPTASVIYWSVVTECKYHRCSKSQKGNKYQQNIIKKEEPNTNNKNLKLTSDIFLSVKVPFTEIKYVLMCTIRKSAITSSL